MHAPAAPRETYSLLFRQQGPLQKRRRAYVRAPATSSGRFRCMSSQQSAHDEHGVHIGATATGSPARSLISLNSMDRPALSDATKARLARRAAPVVRLDAPVAFELVRGARRPIYADTAKSDPPGASLPPQPSPAQPGEVPSLPSLHPTVQGGANQSVGHPAPVKMQNTPPSGSPPAATAGGTGG